MLHPKSDEWKVLDDVQRRAATDSDFRERLLKEPNAALAEVAGRPIPDDFTIRFIEKDASTDALVVLPDLVHETQELSESELEAVAGGADDEDRCWITCILWSCIGTDIDADDGE
ncbi:MAG: NHLP leader peptide family RiPP precursor [bacterium]|nr:NHLP leader peptide family RiPP precursor [bacterium]